MALISVNDGNWALKCAPEKYSKQQLSKDYKFFLSKSKYHTLMF